MKTKRFTKGIYFDKKLTIPILILLFVGFIAILDVSAPKAMETFSDRFYFAKQQGMWIVIGLVFYLIFSYLPYTLWEKYALHLLVISFILLVLVLIPYFGIETLGARRWINLGFSSIQPSEFAKLALCIYVARIASSGKSIAAYFFPIVIMVLLIMAQPDLGTVMTLLFIFFMQLFVSGISVKSVFLYVLLGIILSLILIFSSDYRRDRVTSFMNPFAKNSDTNYHIKQVLYSLANGGISGVGIGQSRQKYLFLPEATTDSIFAVVAEETGFVGVFSILVLYFTISARLLKLASTFKGTYEKVLSIGIFSWFTGQTFINLGSISSTIPFTGVPLPFISYGGSSLLSLLIAFGIFNSLILFNREALG